MYAFWVYKKISEIERRFKRKNESRVRSHHRHGAPLVTPQRLRSRLLFIFPEIKISDGRLLRLCLGCHCFPSSPLPRPM